MLSSFFINSIAIIPFVIFLVLKIYKANEERDQPFFWISVFIEIYVVLIGLLLIFVFIFEVKSGFILCLFENAGRVYFPDCFESS